MNRKTIIFKNVSLGVLYKILNMGIVFTTVPILLNYLEKEQYGLWVTIFSIVNIVFFVDAGIGNGLKTKLTEALSLKNYKLAREYISTAYIFIVVISFVILIIGSGLIFSIDMQKLLNTSVGETYLKIILITTLCMITISFVLSLYKSFYYASQKSSKVELSTLLYQVIVLVLITLMLNYFSRNLLFVAIVYGLSNITVGIAFTIMFFKKNKKIKPSIRFFSRDKIKDLVGLSLRFFFIQLCMIVIFTTDNVIISKLLGASEVTNYDIVYKLFQVVIIISIIAQDPLWSLYTDAYQKKDFKWIRKTLIRLNYLFILFICFVCTLFFVSKSVIKIWIQRDLLLPDNLLLFMSLFVIVRVYGIIYMNFLNSVGKIKLQLNLYIIGAIINIPLSIYFVRYLNLGSSGVILGTIFSIIGMSVFLPIQTFKILKKI